MAAVALGRALGALLTFAFAVVGSLVGIFMGAFMGMSTESGMLRGAGVGAVSGALFSIEENTAPSMSLVAKVLLPFGALPSSGGGAQRPVSVTASLELHY
ncbi:hypothetical protein ZWY2020_037986 [Hordeum vulgare]|nr:hypothetical protein ZWY2020_037986 [Hordeum vulgare]